jgi:DNA polymerase-4
MPTARAVQLCPELVILPGHRKEYVIKSRKIMNILRSYTPNFEQISIDEAFLDISELNKNDFDLAQELQKEIFQTNGLPCSIGIASNKLVAKIATDIGKSAIKTTTYPNAIQIVPPGEEASFLAPLPTEILWGIGPKTASQLGKLGIHTIGNLATWPQEDLIKRFGQVGYELSRRAKGIDYREVVSQRITKSISQEFTFSENVSDERILRKQILKQSNNISKTLNKSNLLGYVVKIKLRWPDFTTITRQTTLPHPTDKGNAIYEAALSLFMDNWKPRLPVRLLGVGVSGLNPPSRQLSLWDTMDYKKLGQLEAAIYEVKKRFGDTSIQQGLQKNPIKQK